MSHPLRDFREVVREEMFMRDRVLTVLKEGPKTVPEIAQVLACPTEEVMFWVMSARKYGHLEELKDVTDEGYYKYRVVEKSQGSNGDKYA